MDFDADIMADFLTESGELLEQLDTDLVSLESTPGDEDLLNQIFRAIHTIKGSASFLGLANLVDCAHAAEDILNAARRDELRVDRRSMDLLLDATAVLRMQFSEIKAGQELTQARRDIIAERGYADMDACYITPFITSIQNVFGTMLQLSVQRRDPSIKSDDAPSYDVSGIISLSGDVDGSTVLSMPMETALRVVSLFTGTECEADNPDFPDAIGELLNMITGNAKAGFEGRKVTLSCPNVIIGKNHHVARLSDVPSILIPFETDCGEINLEISIQDRKAMGGTVVAQAA
ncbi:MAG: chemotaxis protein CheX [Phycisphaerales bacterium]|nr:chemotaxis protein CheX [Phycisphaerales bacterium]